MAAGAVGATAALTRNPADVKKVAANNTAPMEWASPGLMACADERTSIRSRLLPESKYLAQKHEASDFATPGRCALDRLRSSLSKHHLAHQFRGGWQLPGYSSVLARIRPSRMARMNSR